MNLFQLVDTIYKMYNKRQADKQGFRAGSSAPKGNKIRGKDQCMYYRENGQCKRNYPKFFGKRANSARGKTADGKRLRGLP